MKEWNRNDRDLLQTTLRITHVEQAKRMDLMENDETQGWHSSTAKHYHFYIICDLLGDFV